MGLGPAQLGAAILTIGTLRLTRMSDCRAIFSAFQQTDIENSAVICPARIMRAFTRFLARSIRAKKGEPAAAMPAMMRSIRLRVPARGSRCPVSLTNKHFDVDAIGTTRAARPCPRAECAAAPERGSGMIP